MESGVLGLRTRVTDLGLRIKIRGLGFRIFGVGLIGLGL